MSKLQQAVVVWVVALAIATVGVAILYHLPNREMFEENFFFWSLKSLITLGPVMLAWQKTQKIYSRD